MIHKPLGTNDCAQSLGENNRKSDMDAWVASCLLVVNGGRADWMSKATFPKSLLMNPQGGSLLQVSFCNSLIALRLNGIVQTWSSSFSLWRILICMNIRLIFFVCILFMHSEMGDFFNGWAKMTFCRNNERSMSDFNDSVQLCCHKQRFVSSSNFYVIRNFCSGLCFSLLILLIMSLQEPSNVVNTSQNYLSAGEFQIVNF